MMWMIIIPLAGGYALSMWRPGIVAKLPVSAITNVSLVMLLVVMGARIGGNPEVVSDLASLGVQAFILALAAVVGSIVILFLLQLILGVQAQASSNSPRAEAGAGSKLTVMLLGSVAAGGLIGLYLLPESILPVIEELTAWILGLLLLGIGLDLGRSAKVFAELRKLGLGIILIPLGVVLGSVLGAVLVALIGGTVWQEAAAVASGFGWYSLSSVLISQAHSPMLGAVAFIANVFRELIAIIFTPLIARMLGPIPSLGPAGATAMDVMLPVIAKGTGREYVPLAFFSGAVLSLSVPLFVNLFLSI